MILDRSIDLIVKDEVLTLRYRENLPDDDDPEDPGHKGRTVWSSGFALARYVASNPIDFENVVVVELGAGTGLPGITAALVGAKEVHLCDRHDYGDVLAIANQNVLLNHVEQVCSVRGLTWGLMDVSTLSWAQAIIPDYILGADIFYQPMDFEPILATVSLLMERNADAKFVTVYEERSSRRTLEPLLYYWGFEGRRLEFSTEEKSSLSIYCITRAQRNSPT